jgi:predicted Zn-dependent protease
MTANFARTLLAATALTAAGAVSAYAATAMTPPAPGYRPALDTDEGGLWHVMDEAEKDVQVSPALVKDETLNAYVRKIVCDLAGQQCPSLRVYIVDDPESNALTAPNGMVIVWTGLLLRTQNEAELAFVLGHEITHFLKRHSLQNFEKTTRTAGVAAFLTVGAGAIGALVGLGLIGSLASYSRDQEREADAGGFDLIVAKGYDPRQGALFMANTDEEERANPKRKKQWSYLASHPATKERLETLTKRAKDIEAQSHADTVGTEPYREAIKALRPAWLEEEFNRSDYLQSVAMIGQLLKAEPDSGLLHYYLGEAYRRRNAKGDIDAAIESYQAALDKPDTPVAVHRGLGMMALKSGKKDIARDAFQKYLSQAPDADDRSMVQLYLSNAGGTP